MTTIVVCHVEHEEMPARRGGHALRIVRVAARDAEREHARRQHVPLPVHIHIRRDAHGGRRAHAGAEVDPVGHARERRAAGAADDPPVVVDEPDLHQVDIGGRIEQLLDAEHVAVLPPDVLREVAGDQAVRVQAGEEPVGHQRHRLLDLDVGIRLGGAALPLLLDRGHGRGGLQPAREDARVAEDIVHSALGRGEEQDLGIVVVEEEIVVPEHHRELRGQPEEVVHVVAGVRPALIQWIHVRAEAGRHPVAQRAERVLAPAEGPERAPVWLPHPVHVVLGLELDLYGERLAQVQRRLDGAGAEQHQHRQQGYEGPPHHHLPEFLRLNRSTPTENHTRIGPSQSRAWLRQTKFSARPL